MDTLILVLTDTPAALAFVALGLGIFTLDLLSFSLTTDTSRRETDVDQGRHLG
jgi:hypothetical protein